MVRTTRPARSFTASALAAVLALLALNARADSPDGNALNPGALEADRRIDPRGMSAFSTIRRRTPSGLLHPYPPEPASWTALGDAWRVRGSASVGAFFDAGDEDEARFERYTERDDEVFANSLSVELWNPGRGFFFDFTSGGLGRDDAFYALDAGRAGWLRVRASWSRVPHRYANDARTPFTGLGSERLSLSDGLTPGGGTEAAVRAAIAGTEDRGLAIERDRSHVEARLRIFPELALVGRYDFEDRNGRRALGGGFSWPGNPSLGATIETIEPVDDRTQSVRAGIEYASERVQVNLFYDGSFYRNADDALSFENPFQIQPAASVPLGRIQLVPDNDRHGVRLDLAAALPWKTAVSGAISWTRMQQDEDLLPPTINSGTVGVGGFATDLDQWNTRDALSRSSADAEIDTLLVDAALTSRPLKPLRVKLHYQRFRQDDDTRYIAFNPSTGQYGYIPEDGGHQTAFNRLNGRFDPGDPLLSRGDWRFASIPFEWKRDRWDVDLSLRLPARSRAELSYRGERIDREHRERERTREDRVRAALHSRGLPRTSLRISYEVSQRNGSRFDAEALRSFRTSSLPGYTPFFGSVAPLGLASLERPDLTDRDRQALELRAILALAAAMDLSITGRLRSDDYDAAQGLERERVGQISVEWSWQPSPRRGFYAFGSWEARDRDQGNVRGTSALLPNPYPESAAWDVAADLNNLTLGTGLRLQLTESVELQSDYVFQLSSERFDYSFASAAALPTGLTAGQAGSRLPDLQRREHTLETRLRWRARERWTVELYHRLDRSRVDDFQQKGLFVVDGNRLFVGHVDRDYKASVYGVSLIRSF